MKQTVYVNFETREVYGEEEMLDTIEESMNTHYVLDSWLHENYDMADLFDLLPENTKEEMREAFTRDFADGFEKFEIE